MEISFYLPMPPEWIVGALAWWWIFGLISIFFTLPALVSGVRSRNLINARDTQRVAIITLLSVMWPLAVYRSFYAPK